MAPSDRLVLFDIDGTLMRGAGPHHKEALIDGIRRTTGLTTTLDGIDTAGTLDRDLIMRMLKASGYDEGEARRALPRIVDECQAAYVSNCASDLRDRICTGVSEFIRGLRARGVRLGLVTGNLSRIGWKKLELAGLAHHFSVGAFSEDGHTRAELARIAAAKAITEGWVIEGSRIALIGDHSNDVKAAQANGYRSVAVATGQISRDELAKSSPDILVENLAQLDPAELA